MIKRKLSKIFFIITLSIFCITQWQAVFAAASNITDDWEVSQEGAAANTAALDPKIVKAIKQKGNSIGAEKVRVNKRNRNTMDVEFTKADGKKIYKRFVRNGRKLKIKIKGRYDDLKGGNHHFTFTKKTKSGSSSSQKPKSTASSKSTVSSRKFSESQRSEIMGKRPTGVTRSKSYTKSKQAKRYKLSKDAKKALEHSDG
jgi:hypothetical protein